jgi:hypothetical protein
LYISGTTTNTAEIVSLAKPLLKKGHTLWMDNFYNSPALTERLKSMNTDCVGTLRLNGKGVPKTVREKLKKGEMIAQHSDPVSILKWRDKKRRGNDFNIAWGGNKKKVNETWTGKGKACIIC